MDFSDKRRDDRGMMRYAWMDVAEICRELETTPDGLGNVQGSVPSGRDRRDGVPGRPAHSFFFCLRRAFLSPFNIVLLLLGLFTLATDAFFPAGTEKNRAAAISLFAMIFASGLIRLAQELRAKNAVEKLRGLLKKEVTVKRNGKTIGIPADELLIGDCVCLAPGDRVPADIRLTKTKDLFLSQAALTGESALSRKDHAPLAPSSRIAEIDLPNLAFMATTVASGQGEGIVLANGDKTLYSQMAGTRRSAKYDHYRSGALSIAYVLLRFMAFLIPVVFLLLGVTKGRWGESFRFALSVSVGLIPELLPMVVTACLAKGSLEMSRKRTIVKDLNAMEGFGRMDVICMDKTGTLTHEKLLLEYYMDILGDENEEVLDMAYLNSFHQAGCRNLVDQAILACRTMSGREDHYRDLPALHGKVAVLPFDHDRKIASVILTGFNGSRRLVAKGDVARIVSRCTHVGYYGRRLPMGETARRDVGAIVDDMLQDGMKVLAVAIKDVDDTASLTDADEEGLTLIGYLAFFDAPKETARRSIEVLKKLHVIPKILTGDQKDVARSICRRVGIGVADILTGEQVESMDDRVLLERLDQTSLFAEMTPGQKARVTALLRSQGHAVGVLGDGFNDIPAFEEGHVAISVDSAVDAAKDTSDIVLLEKDLGVLGKGIIEGRKTFVNILKYVKITASSNFGNILSIVCASAFLPFLPMTAVQILLLNLLYDSLCLFLPWDHVDPEETQVPKEWSGKTLGRFMLWFGPISSIFDIATFLFLYFVLCPAACGGSAYPELASPALQERFVSLFQTGWFLESMWTQVLILHFLRTPRIPFLQSRPSLPFIIITLFGVIVFTALTFTGGAALVGLTRLPTVYFAFLGAIVLSYMAFTTIAKSCYQRIFHELI